MKYIQKILNILILVLLMGGCVDFDEPTRTDFEDDDGLVDITINFSPSFEEQTMLTRSGATVRLATDRELELKNVTLFVFTNNAAEFYNDPVTGALKTTNPYPDPDGTLLFYADMTKDSRRDVTEPSEDHIKRYYKASVPPIYSQVSAIGVANIDPKILTDLKEKVDLGETVKYSDFRELTLMRIEVQTDSNGKTHPIKDNIYLENKGYGNIDYSLYESPDPPYSELIESNQMGGGLLPLSVDPIQLPALTEPYTGASTGIYPESTFSYARIDVMLYPENDEGLGMSYDERQNTRLLEAYLSNIPNVPLYTADHDAYIDYTNPVTPATNLITSETTNYAYDLSVEAGDMIQGLYMYPNTEDAQSSPEDYTYVIIKAITAQSEIVEAADAAKYGAEEIVIWEEYKDANGNDLTRKKSYWKIPEYFKVLIEYKLEENGVTVKENEHAINRNTRYRIKICEFEGNGYASLNEAIENAPSNVMYDIDIDSSTGNEFVVTNGTSYMALSNTVVDLYGTLENWTDRVFTGFTVYFELNQSSLEGLSAEQIAQIWQSTSKRASSETPGLYVLNESEFSANLQMKDRYSLSLYIDESFWDEDGNVTHDEFGAHATGDISVRIGNLIQRITVNFHELKNNAEEINNYKQTDFTYAYLDVENVDEGDLATWIRFNDTPLLEYFVSDDKGVPINMPALATGQRDNLACPAYIYNQEGESIRVYIYQEDLNVVDFSDKQEVKDYIGGTFGASAVDELVLSNSYILNPGTTNARKYIIPVSSRIKQVWSREPSTVANTGTYKGYATDDQMSEYVDAGLYDASGVFSMPEDWDVKILWYDSERVAAGEFKVQREEPLYKKDADGNLTNEIEEERFSVLIPANIQNYGNILIGVFDSKVDSSKNLQSYDVTQNLLWAWSFWVTDYDPMTIAKNSTPVPDTAQAYSIGGGNGEVHRYKGATWDTTGVNGEMYSNRFIMDRNQGAFDDTLIGHGTILASDGRLSVADPVSGSLTFQHANPRPFPGVGAIDGDGNRIATFVTYSEVDDLGNLVNNGYTTVIGALRRPFNFCVGLRGNSTYSHWLDPAESSIDGSAQDPAGHKDNIWGDKSLRVNIAYNGATQTYPSTEQSKRVTKSIFDPCPLGWMMPSEATFSGFLGALTEDNTNGTGTYESYGGFAHFYFVGYRNSALGQIVRAKNVINNSLVDCYLRTNETYNASLGNVTVSLPGGGTKLVNAYYRDDIAFRIFEGTAYSPSVGNAGKASGCSVRPVTQSRYGVVTTNP